MGATSLSGVERREAARLGPTEEAAAAGRGEHATVVPTASGVASIDGVVGVFIVVVIGEKP